MSQTKLAKTTLGFFPTPLVPLKNLSRLLRGPEIFMKRDDLTGLALGGNKTRKLEYILGDALAHNADTIITAGAAQSNHCRQTAAAAAALQLECHLVLGGKAPEIPTGNLLLNQLFGSHIHWAGKHRKGEDIPQLAKELQKKGKKVYVVPYGGSNSLGATAYVEAMIELHNQTVVDELSHIIFASSSGGTQAGLMVGKKQLGITPKIVGINIDKDESGEISFHDRILVLANETATLMNVNYHFSQQDLHLNSDYIGEGYGVIGELEKEAISLTASSEGILLDPVYTGRAMGGLIDMIRKQEIAPGEKVLFWHTGGTPALFAGET